MDIREENKPFCLVYSCDFDIPIFKIILAKPKLKKAESSNYSIQLINI